MPIRQAEKSYWTVTPRCGDPMGMDAVRKRIVNALEGKGLTLKEASLRLGRNHAYLQQFVEREIPRSLKEADRQALAELLNVPEEELGAPALKRVPANTNISTVPEYDVQVSAGGGAVVAEENKKRDWPFATDYLRFELGLQRQRLSVIEVLGDSMEPTLSSGDRVLVNLGDKRISQPGIFVLFDGDGTVVKRVEKIPASEPARIKLISDNERHGTYEVLAESVQIIGRVVWRAGRI